MYIYITGNNMSNYRLLSDEYKLAIWDWSVISYDADFDMWRYLIGSDFSMSTFKKAK